MHEWNPDWCDRAEPLMVMTMRCMITASINWIAHNPSAWPEWRESPSAASDGSMDWRQGFDPINIDAEHWFATISNAANGHPSCQLMTRAISIGILFWQCGWERFNRLMLQSETPSLPLA